MAKDPNKDIIDAFSKALENPKYKLTDADQIRLDRLKAIFIRWKSNPLITETQMRDYIITQFGIGRVQAYRDMATVKLLFGSAPKAEKEFQRMRANRLLEAAQAAALAGDDKQAKSLTKIAEVIVKTNRMAKITRGKRLFPAMNPSAWILKPSALQRFPTLKKR